MNTTDFGRIPPQAIDLEEAVLGALMLEQDQIDQVINLLIPESFYKDAHQIIYKAIQDLHSQNKQIDLLTINEQLKKTKNLEVVGGPLYLTQLAGKVASSLHITDHALIIKQKYIQRELIRISQETLKAGFDDSVDVSDLLDETSSKLERISESAISGSGPVAFQDVIQESLKEAEQRIKVKQSGQLPGIHCPLVDLSRITGGWQPGDLIVLAGRPSMGKTAFALATAKTAGRQGKHVAIFSLEMIDIRLADRLITGEAGIDPERYRNGNLIDQEWTAIEGSLDKLLDLNIHIDDSSITNMENIRVRARILKRKGQCDMIVIDYLQLIDSNRKDRNREQEVSEISRKCKALAKDLNVPVILLSQLNRACEQRNDKRPRLSDLRESGAIEQDADLVLLLYRPEAYGIMKDDSGNSLKGVGELIIGKYRSGRIGTLKFGYNESLTRIYDLPRDGMDMEPAESSVKVISIREEVPPGEDSKSKQYKE